MKRSKINTSIDQAVTFFKKMQFILPPFALWTPDEWIKKGDEYKEIKRAHLGWDVTDFGSDDFKNIGRTIFTLRNSTAYAQKVMMMAENQLSPVHYHKSKMEDIVNMGGGQIGIKLWCADDKNALSNENITVYIDGCLRECEPGDTVFLDPGESIRVNPYVYHQFWAEHDTVLSMEVSSASNDLTDNYFLESMERFPEIEEDEPSGWILCMEYQNVSHR